MTTREVLTATEVAEILGISVQAIRNAVHSGKEGVSIPPSTKFGGRRRWVRRVVYAWLREKAIAFDTPHQRHSNSDQSRDSFSHSQESKAMNTEIPKIFCGHAYATADGEEFTVVDLDPKNGRVIIEASDGHQGVIDLDEMLEAIRTGEITSVDEQDEDSDGAENA